MQLLVLLYPELKQHLQTHLPLQEKEMQWTGKEMQSHPVGKMKASQVFSPHLSPADDVMTQLEREDGSKA